MKPMRSYTVRSTPGSGGIDAIARDCHLLTGSREQRDDLEAVESFRSVVTTCRRSPATSVATATSVGSVCKLTLGVSDTAVSNASRAG